MRRFFRSIFQRRLRGNRYLQGILVTLVYLIATTIILPRSFQLDFQYEVGKKWREPTLESPFEFPIYKVPEEIQAERDSALSQVFLIFRNDSNQVKRSRERVARRLEEFHFNLRQYSLARAAKETVRANRLASQFFIPNFGVSPESFPLDTSRFKPAWLRNLHREAQGLLAAIYQQGYIEGARDTFSHSFISLRVAPTRSKIVALDKLVFKETLRENIAMLLSESDQPTGQLLQRVLVEVTEPNLLFDSQLTSQERQRVESLISPIEGKVLPRQPIIRRGEIVSPEKDKILRSLILEKEKSFGQRSSLSIIFSQFLVVSLITSLLLLFLRVNKPRIYFNPNKLGLILLVTFLTVGAMILTLNFEEVTSVQNYISFIYLAPTCLAAVVVTNFFDSRTGFLVNLLVALYGAVLVQRGLEFAFVQIMAGTVAVYSLRRLRDRQVFFYTLGYLAFAYAVVYVIFNLFSKGNLAEISYGNLLIFIFNVSLTILAYPLIYIFERIFSLTSDLTYLELLDTNHPLLQRLARKAPGTFQHSLQVANIAEAVAQVIGGNSLLIHVGALYHDIGKSTNPQFFIENSSVEDSPHNELSCPESAEIIIDHVAQGVELAQRYKLPNEIIDFIETHHGTTRVEFFYRKYLKELDCDLTEEEEEKFHYPGPLPFSKETAVLMIADSIEAASRSLSNPTEEDLKKLMNNIINYKISAGQLENSPLTFKDLSTMRKVIFKQLQSIYHGRIRYPEEK